jgi:hypothetical protein
MKLSHIFLIVGILLCAVLVVPVSAVTWVPYGDAWKSTDAYPGNITIMWNQTGPHAWLSTGNATTVRYLVVAAGGGTQNTGGQGYGGGGGGGFLTGINYPVSGALNVIVGGGGRGVKGQNSSFANTTIGNGINAMGGGIGDGYTKAGDGGSGGGCADAGRGGIIGNGISGQGYNGGLGWTDSSTYTVGCGGGGAGSVGA